ncbi:MAG: DUF2332 domain-containing protein [Actinomycetota bacterium]|nr:DUF2332 domain-containing protein [Actinomycetota bacterium]
MQTRGPVVTMYADFAATSDSPCFTEWAQGVAGDPEVHAWLATLPDGKRQPNLVFAAARWNGVPAPGPYAGLRDALLSDDGTIRATILARATQTNEAGRLATLVPAFAMIAAGEPVALVEVGASAGLCLHPDGWGYEWTTASGVRTAGPAAPTLRCAVRGAAPLPSRTPTIAWRGGVDLHPLDVTDADQMAWLTMLVWPEHDDRREQLRRAIQVSRTDPPDIVEGDLFDELPALVARAAEHARVVVFHSAVVAYLDDEGRGRFHDLMAGLVADGACHWVSNEGERVLPGVAAGAPPSTEAGEKFVLGLDGRPVAWTHGHGRSMTWL